ncbi:MAG TPA: peptide deformylase [Gaiellaceae bacterium]|nr:peptide deformylase [Gaiellaceae bacterium]
MAGDIEQGVDELESEEELDPRAAAERDARRRAALAQIRQYPDPALRMRANEVEEFDEALARLAVKMADLMREAHGIGLAATQIGVLQRLFVFQREGEEEPTALVNPRIVERGSETDVLDEGCLSLQRVHVPVERATSLVLEAQDLAGGELRLELEDMDARVAQHELDHLDGVLMLERTDPASRREAIATLRRNL